MTSEIPEHTVYRYHNTTTLDVRNTTVDRQHEGIHGATQFTNCFVVGEGVVAELRETTAPLTSSISVERKRKAGRSSRRILMNHLEYRLSN